MRIVEDYLLTKPNMNFVELTFIMPIVMIWRSWLHYQKYRSFYSKKYILIEIASYKGVDKAWELTQQLVNEFKILGYDGEYVNKVKKVGWDKGFLGGDDGFDIKIFSDVNITQLKNRCKKLEYNNEKKKKKRLLI